MRCMSHQMASGWRFVSVKREAREERGTGWGDGLTIYGDL